MTHPHKLYLAGRMRGVPEFNFPAFMRVAGQLRALGYEVCNPAEHDLEEGFDATGLSGTDEELRRAHFDLAGALRYDLGWIIDHADGVALMAGWPQSTGSRLEAAVAQAIGLPLFEVDDPVTGLTPIRAGIVHRVEGIIYVV